MSKTCLVRFDNNEYSVNASAVGRPVEIHAYADRIVIRQDGRIVAEHPAATVEARRFRPWHYVPVLARKPGALRNGAPFRDWVLPAALERVRRKLAGSDDGDRQMVAILATVLTDGLPALSCLRAGDVRGRPLIRCDHQHPHAAPRSGSGGQHPHAGCADAAPCAGRRLRQIRSTQERMSMERTEVLDMMGELKLFGMKGAYDESWPPRSSASTNRSGLWAICSRPRSAREAGALDQIPADHRQAAARQGCR